ncbi:hypothetical protein ACFOWE_17325 [Planomonospora corallina]|uniref:Uncharacterized protein n=1 Tax=Planomonospora corallina TaxID=1806052 RepID=A0ABV8IAV1_9ACTN
MPKSRLRKAAADKARRRRAAAHPPIERHEFTQAPWRVWQELRERHPDESQFADVVSALPYQMTTGGRSTVVVSLRQVATGNGVPVADAVAGLLALEELGALTWDPRTQTAHLDPAEGPALECGHRPADVDPDGCAVCRAALDRLTPGTLT